jgi:hypothetical protein
MLLASAGAVFSAGGTPPGIQDGTPPSSAPIKGSDFQWQGAGSCAAAACHNGNGPAGAWRSEYSTWVTLDKHAQAYEVLYGPSSQLIEKNFRRLERIEDAHAERDDLCLKCHAMNEKVPRRKSFSVEDGVGCESCHGASEKWLSRHYTPSAWSSLDKNALGFRLTRNDLVGRAEICVACHVGSPDRQVNHDLIAAGHPWLRFELGAYLANMRKHWDAEVDVKVDKGGRPDYEARIWAIGQAASARAALNLLADRATDSNKPWPEFAEYDCFACHHDLEAKSWRQERLARRRPENLATKAGSPPWAAWYVALLPSSLSVSSPKSSNPIAASLRELQAEMSKTVADRERVAQHARDTAAQLSSALDQSRHAALLDVGTLQRLVDALGRADNFPSETWQGASQRYLALTALYLSEVQMGSADEALHANIKALWEKLSFPIGYAAPRGFDPKLLNDRPKR